MVVRRSRHRLLALLCGVLAALTLTTPAVAAPERAALTRPEAAGGWLARQLVDGERFEAVFDGVAYPDQGLTLDAVFAFAAGGVADDHGADALAWVTRPDIRDGYLGDGVSEAYAGATAKLALAVQVRGGDPADVGGVDLIARLRSLQTPAGRFSDRSAYGDYSNAFSQSFALLALDRTAAGRHRRRPPGWPAPGARTAATRCCPRNRPARPTWTPPSRDAGPARRGPSGRRRRRAALAGVRSACRRRLHNAAGTPNANSTGLAAQALRDGHRLPAWARARAFLAGLQVGCAGTPADRGAVDFDGGGFDPATAPRATAQAVLGLTGIGYARLSAAGADPGAPALACP
ncbi:peptidase [Micromonospora sp. BRA006-A]|nr:peptidase [Micromonospora sp. BRA006-A]